MPLVTAVSLLFHGEWLDERNGWDGVVLVGVAWVHWLRAAISSFRWDEQSGLLVVVLW